MVAAELSLEGDVLERLDAIGERLFDIGVPEEFGIAETGAQHALVAATDLAVRIAVEVGYGDEAVIELAGLAVFDRKILLMDEHRRFEDFVGEREETLLEVAANDSRVLG